MQQREYKYTEDVLKFVRFKYDHIDIRNELNEHIEDMLEFAPEMSEEETENYIRDNMGNAEELGKELDKEHKPLLGWIWRISRILAILVFLINIPTFINFALVSAHTVFDVVQGYESFNPNEERTHTVETKIKGQIDDVHIYVDRIDKFEDGTVTVNYKTIHNPFGKSQGWTFGLGNCYFDEYGNKYFGGGGAGGSFISHHVDNLNEFPDDARLLIIDYDYHGREFYAEIPLEWEVAK